MCVCVCVYVCMNVARQVVSRRVQRTSRFMLNSTVHKPDTDQVATYSKHVFGELHGLLSLDSVKNPTPLTGNLLAAVVFLENTCGIGRNHLRDVDISNQKLDKRHFM